MTIWHDRSTLGLRAPNEAHLTEATTLDRSARWGLTIHWTGFGGTLYHPDPVQRLRNIQTYHMDTLGYGDVAYNFAFDAQANVFGLRDARWVGAHAGSNGNVANRLTIGAVFLEDVEKWTAGASDAYGWLVAVFQLAYHRHPVPVAHEWWSKGGRGGTGTECPGPYVSNVIRFTGGLT